jgi:hypothetical protein
VEEEIIHLFEDGASATAISEKVGLSRSAVIGRVSSLHAAGILAERYGSKTRRVETNLPRRVLELFEARDGTLAIESTVFGMTCMWPLGDVGAEDFGYCGGTTGRGRHYCDSHHRIAYTGKAK